MTSTEPFSLEGFDELLHSFEFAANLIDPPQVEDWHGLPHFDPPPPLPWYLYMMFGGRGSGKTEHATKYLHDHIHGPPCLPNIPGGHWPAIVAPTLGDAVTSVVEGPSGLRKFDPGIKVLNRPGGIIARWSNGCEAKLFGAHSPEDVERFRSGGNRCIVLMEEFAAWRYLQECWDQIRFGLRSGPQPRAIASTTPRTKKLIKELVKESKDPTSNVKLRHGTMDQNPHLPEHIKEELRKTYGDTRMGRQELSGELLEDIEGALWDGETIDRWRVRKEDVPEEYDLIVVAIDPAASEGGDEHGIVVVGFKYTWDDWTWIQHQDLSHGFVLEDASCSGKPNKWGKRAIKCYRDWKADRMVAEVNNGGDMVEHVILGIDDGVPVIKVHATRGKAKRAEPVANLYSQGRVHHVGMFPKLEDQMTMYDPTDIDDSWSPDHMDALVWAVTEGMLESVKIHTSKPQDDRLRGRR